MPLLLLITLAADQAPEPEDVKAGWTAFLIFILLIAAVVFLGFSLVKQLRKAQASEDAGLYDHDDKQKRRTFPVDYTDAPENPDDGQAADDTETADNGEPHPRP
jgi:hypothetical protein